MITPMYVRRIKRKTTQNVAVQLVHSERLPGGRVKQHLMRHMGSAPEGPALDALLALARSELATERQRRVRELFPNFVEGTLVEAARRRPNHQPLPIEDARGLQAQRTLTVGIHDVFGRIYEAMDFGAVWTPRQRVAQAAFRETVLARLARPGLSKLGFADREAVYFGVEDLPVEKIYRMMDHLTPARCRALRARVRDGYRTLFDDPPQAVMMDVTTLAFASERADALRRKGYSKDGKPHRVQVVLALIQSPHGWPLDYELYPGNTADVATLQGLAKRLRKAHGVTRVTVVMDAGMTSKAKLEQLANAGLNYVAAARVGTLPVAELRAIQAADGWADGPRSVATAAPDRLLDWHVDGRRLVLKYSPAHAARDAAQRAEALTQANDAIAGGAARKRGRLRYVRYDDAALSLDEAAIEKSILRDGLHGVWTNLAPADAAAVRAIYADLWGIEQAFRVMKHTVRIRPMFHWTERRVHAHVAICYTAFAMLRYLRMRYAVTHAGQPALSEDRLLAELGHVHVTRVVDRNTRKAYLIPQQLNREQRAIYTTAQVTPQMETLEIPFDDKPASRTRKRTRKRTGKRHRNDR